MSLPASFLDLFNHPAPGLVFGPHERAGVGRRAYHAPHFLPGRPLWWRRRLVRKLASRHPAALADFVEFYTAHDGCALCIRPDTLNGGYAAALTFLPVAVWSAAIRPFLRAGDRAWALDELPFYRSGEWRVFAASPSESTCLTIFFDGEHQGRSLAGQIYYISLDPVLSMKEPLAPTFADLLDRIGRDPAAFLSDMGYCSHVQSEQGDYYGDPAEAYTPDVRTHPDHAPA